MKLSFLFAGSLLILTSCSYRAYRFNGDLGSEISGSADFFAGALSLSAGAQKSSCASAIVSLHAIAATGAVEPTAILSAPIREDGSFTLSQIKQKGVNLSDEKVKYVLKASGCDSENFRPLTDYKEQNITGGSTLLVLTSRVEDEHKKPLPQVDRKEVERLLSALGHTSSSTLTNLLNELISNAELAQSFASLTNVSPEKLKDLPPENWTLQAPASLPEFATTSYSVSVNHWNEAYHPAYEWSLDGHVMSTLPTWNYETGKNSQGVHSLKLRIGSDAGDGSIDAGKPVKTETLTLQVTDTFPATAPALALLGNFKRNSLSGSLTLTTGAALIHCGTFSKLALTENPFVPPISPLDFNIECTDSGTQNLPFLLSAGDGLKSLALWALDSAGNISAVPSSSSVLLDQTAPSVTLSSVDPLQGGSIKPITYAVSDATSGLQTVLLDFASDGVTFSQIMDLSAATSPVNWAVPLAETSGARLKLRVTDEAGNLSEVPSNFFSIDSTAPAALTLTRSSSPVSSSPLLSMDVAGCSGDALFMLFSESTTAPAANDPNWENCALSKSFTVSTGTGDGTKTVSAWSKDAVGNISSSAQVSFVLDQTAPLIQLTSFDSGAFKGGASEDVTWTLSEANGAGQSLTIGFSTDDGTSWTDLATSPMGSGSYTWALPLLNTDQVRLKISGCDVAGNCSSQISSSRLSIDSLSPVFTASKMSLNGGASTTPNNSVQVAMAVTDNLLNITHFCLKYSTGTSVPASPSATDSCWIPVNNPSPGLAPAPNISFDNFYYTLGFTTGTYSVYAWAKDAVGNLSEMSNAGSGTLGSDKAVINYESGQPPVVINALSTQADTFSNPPTSTEMTIAAGTDVYIRWKATDDYTLPSQAVSLSYTTDEINYVPIASNLANSAQNGCTVDGTNHTGCYRWVAGSPTSGYFKIRVAVTDSSGMTTLTSSPAVNTGSFRFLAGNTDPGTGGSASSAMIFNQVDTMATDTRTLVVAPNGIFYLRDTSRGIVSVDPADGKFKVLIPFTGVSKDGALGVATLGTSSARITLDFQGNLLIGERDRIRKVDFATGTVSTLVGGGASTGSGILGTELVISCTAGTAFGCPLTALPNGDLYFFRKSGGGFTDADTLYHYKAADGRVESIHPTGTGAQDVPSLDLSKSRFTHFGVEFDPTTSALQRFYTHYHRDPCVGCGNEMLPALMDPSTWASTGAGYDVSEIYNYSPHSFVTSMNGQLYSIPEYDNRPRGLWRLDRGLNTWTQILGGGVTGSCPDGTLATSCNVLLQDAFITAQEQVYFLDNGLVRTIDENKQVRTLFGQRKTFGDGGLALSARFNRILSMDQTSTGKIVILDRIENVLREITVGGNVVKLAGNGTAQSSTSGVAADTQAVAGGYWGNNYHIHVDRSTDDVFFTSPGREIFRYVRSSGLAEKVVGGGATRYDTADALDGSAIQLGGYPSQILGFDGAKLLVALNIWNGSNHERAYWKFYDKNDLFRQSQFTGNDLVLDGTQTSFADGALVSTATATTSFSDQNLRGYWDAGSSTWYFGSNGGKTIRAMPIGGNISYPYTFPRNYNSWTMTKNASSQWVFYYCSGGRVYKYNGATAVETALPWPSSTISCNGSSMFRNDARNSIVFPFAQNGLQGVAEILDTP